MTHGSLFSGIGGFDLAAARTGWTNVFQCEYDTYCQKVLNKNFKKTELYSNIYDFDAKKYKNKIDVISGGFPCQPFSIAGKQRGKKDDRYLWPQMLRVIQEVKPSYVVCENVPRLATLENGKTIKDILTSLESEGYHTETFLIPAAAVGALHKRNRLWIVAYTSSFRWNEDEVQMQTYRKTYSKTRTKFSNFQYSYNGSRNIILSDHHKSEVSGGVDGLPSKLDIDRVKALGNAIVPEIAHIIFQTINHLENQRIK